MSSGFDVTLIQLTSGHIVDRYSDICAAIVTGQIQNDTNMPSSGKASAIQKVLDAPVKNEPKFQHLIRKVVEEMYSDIQSTLLNHTVVVVTGGTSGIRTTGTVSITVPTIGVVTGLVISTGTITPSSSGTLTGYIRFPSY